MKNKSAWFIVISLVVSIALGLLLQDNIEVANKFAPLGTIYINLIKMIMVPLVFTSLVLGISSLTSMSRLGKMAGCTVAWFLFTTGIAVVIGLILSNIFKPGSGIFIENLSYEAKDMPTISAFIVSIFPDNILQAMLNGNMLQIIFISIVFAVAMVKIAPKGEGIKKVIEDVYEIMITITKGVMVLTPIGILGLMVPTVASNGISTLIPLAKLIGVFYLAVLIHLVLVYFLSIKSFTKFSITEFEKAMLPSQLVAFVSCSSAAALPISLKQTQEELKISKEVSGFVLPLGSTVNMDGNALYQGIVALFIAQAYGMQLSIPMQITVIITGTLASIGAAGVPGAGMIVLSTVLASVGLPLDGIALIAGIDRILDMGRTFINVTGDAVTACAVDNIMVKKDTSIKVK